MKYWLQSVLVILGDPEPQSRGRGRNTVYADGPRSQLYDLGFLI